MTFRVGQKVVCVDASLTLTAMTLRWAFRMGWPLVKGEVYTIQRLAVLLNTQAVELVEVKNTKHLERCFRLDRFRPVVERKTDISVFTEMLKPVRAPAVLLSSNK
jgi:hypothetical protein